MINPKAEDIGKWVYYIPKHLRKSNIWNVCKRGSKDHGNCEHGIISSFNERYIHVLYQGKNNSQATSREDLEWE